MESRMKTILCMLAVLFTTSFVAHGGDADASARVEILALERAWNQAYQDGDAKAITSLFDDSLVMIEGDGSIKTKSQYLASVHKHSVNQEQATIEALNVNVFGNAAVAIGQLLVKGAQAGKLTVHKERFIDTWISKNGVWVLVASDSTPILHTTN